MMRNSNTHPAHIKHDPQKKNKKIWKWKLPESEGKSRRATSCIAWRDVVIWRAMPDKRSRDFHKQGTLALKSRPYLTLNLKTCTCRTREIFLLLNHNTGLYRCETFQYSEEMGIFLCYDFLGFGCERDGNWNCGIGVKVDVASGGSDGGDGWMEKNKWVRERRITEVHHRRRDVEEEKKK